MITTVKSYESAIVNLEPISERVNDSQYQEAAASVCNLSKVGSWENCLGEYV